MNRHSTINFLRERVRLQEEVLVADRRIALFTSIALGLFMTVFIGIVGYQFFLRSQVKSLDLQIVETQTELTTLDDTSQLLADRNALLSTIASVLSKRGKSWEAIDYLYTILPPESTIQAINLSSTDGSLEFDVHTPTIFGFDALSATLQSEKVKQSGLTPTLGTLDRKSDGSYTLNVRLLIQPQTANSSENVETSEEITPVL